MKKLILAVLLLSSGISAAHAAETTGTETWVFKCTSDKAAAPLIVSFRDTHYDDKTSDRVATWDNNYDMPLYFTGSAPNDNGHMATVYFFAHEDDKGATVGETLVIEHTPKEKLITYKRANDKTHNKDGSKVFDSGVCQLTDHTN